MLRTPHRLRWVPWISGSSLIRPPAAREPQAQLDVLDGRRAEAPVVEAVDLDEGVAPHRPQAGPEGGRDATRALVDVVVEHVPKGRHRPVQRGQVVVGAEDRDQLGLRLERGPDPGEHVGVHQHVRIDEHEDRSLRPRGARIARGGWAHARRRVDHDHLVGRVVGGEDRVHAAIHRGRAVGRGHDRAVGRRGPVGDQRPRGMGERLGVSRGGAGHARFARQSGHGAVRVSPPNLMSTVTAIQRARHHLGSSASP